MDTLNTITAIVPRLPPAIDGLGDYGLLLAKQLRQDFGLTTDFIVGEPNWSFKAFVEGFAVKRVETPSCKSLLQILPSESEVTVTVILHYVGYGYARRGCPLWLIEGLERWRKAANNRRLVTMFHEIYAFGPIWTSQFWTSPLQRNLATRLINISDRCFTSKQGYAEIISKFSQRKHPTIPVLPVFSNVGEPQDLPLLSNRRQRLIVFGGRGSRSRVYQRSLLALERTCRELEIEEIIDIGPPLEFKIETVNKIAVISLGERSPEEISNLLLSAIVGFFDYPVEYLAKSGIFAAYCAHRLLPIGVGYEGQDVDGLEREKHYWLVNQHCSIMNLSDGQIVANNAYLWYQKHPLSVHARSFATSLMATA